LLSEISNREHSKCKGESRDVCWIYVQINRWSTIKDSWILALDQDEIRIIICSSFISARFISWLSFYTLNAAVLSVIVDLGC